MRGAWTQRVEWCAGLLAAGLARGGAADLGVVGFHAPAACRGTRRRLEVFARLGGLSRRRVGVAP